MNKAEKNKLTREMLYVKFDGLCAFCGHVLGERWQAWNIQPAKMAVTFKGEIILGNDSYENKLPACFSCNTTRRNASCSKDDLIDVEKFRKALYREFDFLRQAEHTAYTYYRKAIKYGLIVETGNPIVFHFEKTH